MKKTLLVLSIVCGATAANAQKHHLYADAGISLSQFVPGASVTYNYNFIPYIGIGAGVQAFGFFPTVTNGHTFVPAVFGDVRFNIRPKKSNQFFVLLDIGINFYKHNKTAHTEGYWAYYVDKDNGTYSSVGFGYLHKFAKRGAIYTTLKTVTNHYQQKAWNILTGELRAGEGASRGTLAVSFGFRW